MTKLALTLVAAALSVAAVQDEMVENPEYKGWAGQKVGAWVKFKTELDAGGKKMESSATRKLKEMTAEKAVLESVMEMDMGGEKRTMNAPPRNVPAKVKKGTDSDGSKVEIVGEGDEEIEIKGEKIKCHWVEMKMTGKAGTMNAKVWQTDKVVGGAAKMTLKSDKMNTTMVAVDWKAGE